MLSGARRGGGHLHGAQFDAAAVARDRCALTCPAAVLPPMRRVNSMSSMVVRRNAALTPVDQGNGAGGVEAEVRVPFGAGDAACDVLGTGDERKPLKGGKRAPRAAGSQTRVLMRQALPVLVGALLMVPIVTWQAWNCGPAQPEALLGDLPPGSHPPSLQALPANGSAHAQSLVAAAGGWAGGAWLDGRGPVAGVWAG